MAELSSSVLIATYRRPDHLEGCLRALTAQTRPPDQVIVAWQGDDVATRDRALAIAAEQPPYSLVVRHCARPGIVPAENTALDAATSDVILLIDDDARPPVGWVERHLSFYADPSVGAVGGPADNHRPDGTPFPRRDVEPVGVLTWYGRLRGNMYDHVPEWRSRSPRRVDHLVGYNMSLRRVAFDRFAEELRGYWQLFELEACLQVRARGYAVLFDFGNVVDHFPSNTTFAGGRDGDLERKIFGSAFNHAFIMARYSTTPAWIVRLAYSIAVGSVSTPGLLGAVVASRRHGNVARELEIFLRTLGSTLHGASRGRAARCSSARRD